ncbi:MFS transporter [Acinetobacter ursingii]|uniref:YbfB/YjiJ family MFS transporter n=1 Tax=Acinetobacter ursingii TaxID=108980 RepID=UPI00124EC14E|nr:YbfB/YjiJ family MFS transporter [Acinetobacter ursingii]MCU4304647.1 MFS transporter [Acinetobacter ursingii]MCU4370652.1 MFS transporter [Acinetobacter ursingii]MDG9991050.1 MFS transporter [Acinetobacter ursingii]MDH0203240.1 MFS transporter [Acinetobacter ursingii]
MQNTSRLFWVAFLSTCLGIGLFRFSYTSLMPLLVEQKWFTASFASYLSSANLLGYLIGALLAHPASRYIQDKKLISISAFLGSLSLLLCAIHGLPEFLYIVFRLFSGIAGATLMVLAPSYALRRVEPEIRQRLSMVAFSGIGAGVVISTFIVPYAAKINVGLGWLFLGVLSLIFSFVIFIGLQGQQKTLQTHQIYQSGISLAPKYVQMAGLIIAAYALSAIAYIPHSLFWIDFIQHELHQSVQFSNQQWAFYGIGSMLGAVFAFYCSKHWQISGALWRCYLLYSLAIFIPVYFHHFYSLALSSFLTGLLNPAVVSLSSSALLNILGTQNHQSAWSIATAAFATAQLLGGLLISFLHTSGVIYPHLFFLGAMMMSLGFVCSVCFYMIQKLNSSQLKGEG